MKLIHSQTSEERLIPKSNVGKSFYYEHLARYLFATQVVREKTVLDIACGVGYGTKLLATHGAARHATGVDISEEAILYAKKTYSTNNISFIQDNANTLTKLVGQSFDAIVSFETIEHLSDPDLLILSLKKVLNSDGILIVSTPNKLTYPMGNIYHKHELTPVEFKRLLRKQFSFCDFYYQTFDFSQSIKKTNTVNFKFDNNYILNMKQVYENPIKINQSQYIIAVCSNISLPNINTVSVYSPSVDGFDLSRGILSLSQQFKYSADVIQNKSNEVAILEEKINSINPLLHETEVTINENYELMNKIRQLTNEINTIKIQLDSLKATKFFSFWQLYNKFKIFRKSNAQ